MIRTVPSVTYVHAASDRSPAQADALRYRPDLDGLRAVAVICVMLYHGHVAAFGGGYIGVDVFFVISGYFIMRLLAEPATGTPRSWLTSFYLRRARRILPALLVTLALLTALAPVLLLPLELEHLGMFLTAAVVQLPNLAGWAYGNYFINGDASPLMHLWSLGVEEQFYITFPLVLLLLTRYLPQQRLLALSLLAILSFLLCVWGSIYKPGANFYLLPSRAWELLLGAVVALGQPHLRLAERARQCLAAAAVLALALCVFTYGAHGLSYPGVATLVPCAAAALLIVTGTETGTVVSRLLSAPPLVFTGLVSYSLYLWHVPNLRLFEWYQLGAPGPVALAGLFAATYAIAVLSWMLIERPVRTRAVLRSNRTFLITVAAVSIVLLTTGVTFWNSDGFPERFGPALVPSRWPPDWQCAHRTPLQVARGELCSYGPSSGEAATALVWGDSHALVLMPAYQQLADVHHMRIYFAVKPSCLPLLGVRNAMHPPATQAGCAQFNRNVAQAITALRPDVVLLNGRWFSPGAQLVIDPGVAHLAGASTLQSAVEETLRQIGAAGRSVCAVLDVPAFPYDVPRYLVTAKLRGLSSDPLQLTRAEARQQLAATDRDFHQLERNGKLTTVDPTDLICPGELCPVVVGGQVLYGDTNHLSAAGAMRVMSSLDGCFGSVKPRPVAAGFRPAR